jgi:hypothetical protein
MEEYEKKKREQLRYIMDFYLNHRMKYSIKVSFESHTWNSGIIDMERWKQDIVFVFLQNVYGTTYSLRFIREILHILLSKSAPYEIFFRNPILQSLYGFHFPKQSLNTL